VILDQNKHLMLARLKTRVQQVLVRAEIPGLPIDMLCALSVDDVVRVAQELYSGVKASSLDAMNNEPAL
jgi:hypothetical protein